MRFVKKKTVFLVSLLSLAAASSVVYSHCQIPCGIYDDDARFKMIAEHITTIEKSIVSINQLSANPKPDYNQIVRWVDNKEKHADAASDIITYYFLTQRLKPVANNNPQEYQKYIRQLTVLHEMLVHFMNAKQSADEAIAEKLRSLLGRFENEYFLSRR